jgi:hypothetical protein
MRSLNLKKFIILILSIFINYLFQKKDVDVSNPDEKSIITYVSSLYYALSKPHSIPNLTTSISSKNQTPRNHQESIKKVFCLCFFLLISKYKNNLDIFYIETGKKRLISRVLAAI